MYRLFLVVVSIAIFVNAFSASAWSQELAGVKCVVEGDRNAQEQFKGSHADGEVYFCCEECAAAFAADSSAHQTRANHQLVVTQQYAQTACPIAGKDFNTEQTAKVGGVEVAFCCGTCKTQVETAVDLPAKAELVFGPAAFKRAFSKSKSESALSKIDLSEVECLVDPKRLAQQAFVADHRDGKIFFCCEGCLKAYQADPVSFSTQANMQLVSTKQYTQSGCPLTDGEVDASKTVTVGGQEVAFCCGGCLSKVQSATEEDRVAMIFDDAAFEKSFAKFEMAGPKEAGVAPDELPAPGS